MPSLPSRTSGIALRLGAAAAVALSGVVTLSSSLSPDVPARARLVDALEPRGLPAVAHVAGAVGGLVLLGLSLGVARGRRDAVRAGAVVLGVLVVVHALKGLDYEEAVTSALVALALHGGIRAAARGRAPSRLAIAALLTGLALAATYAIAVTAILLGRRPPEAEDAMGRAAIALGHLVAAGTAAGLSRSSLHLALVVAAVGLVAAVRALAAPALSRDGHDAGEHVRARELVSAWGTDSISPFVLRADKAFFFAHGGVVAYRTLGGTAVVSGDPVAPPGAAPRVLAEFVASAERRGWDVAVMSAGEQHLRGYAALGLRSVRIGSEAIVDPRTFSLEGRQAKTVRKAVHRVERAGWTVEVLPAARLDGAAIRGIEAVEEAWRRTRPRAFGFAMASDRLWGAPEDATDLLALARTPEGEIRAFQRYVRYRGGLSLDAMRRLDDQPNGISDALVAAVLARAAQEGLAEVSLNFSTFAHLLAGEPPDSRSLRVAAWCLRGLRGRFQLDRLLAFTRKFGAVERPRYVVYTRRTRLPVAALRIMQAEAYVRPPRLVLRREAWRPHPRPAGVQPTGAAG